MSEVAILSGKKYDKNKVAVKGLFKQHELTFDRGLMMRENRFIWKNEEQSVEGIFEKDLDGNTISAEFEWNGKEDTQLKKDLKRTIIILGGSWEEKEIELSPDNKLEEFDKNMIRKLEIEETKARSTQWYHSPILKPMANQFLTEREEQFGKTDIDVYELINRIHELVNNQKGGI